jgi:hypothetical protein
MHLLAVTHGPLEMMINPVSVTMRHSIHSNGSLRPISFDTTAVSKDLHATVVLAQHDVLDALVHSPHPRLRGMLMYKADSFPIVHKQP